MDAGREYLVFSHANGFPMPAYRHLLAPLGEAFTVSGVTRFGHDARYPVGPHWVGLTDELLAHVDGHVPPDRPLWLVGHSLGGFLSLLAGARLGQRVSGIVVMDSPLLSPARGQAFRLVRRLGQVHRLIPHLQKTLQRRTHWPDVDAVVEHFAAKRSFSSWHPDVLRDYALHGTLEQADGSRQLLFDPRVEHAIYASLPSRVVTGAIKKLQCPVGFLAGTHSRELRQAGYRTSQRVAGPHFEWMEGGHLFPMENPDATARSIMARIDAMRTTKRTRDCSVTQ